MVILVLLGLWEHVNVPPHEAARGEVRMGLKRRPPGRAGDAQVSPRSPGMSVGPLGASQWVQGSSPTPYSWFPVAHASEEALHLIASLLSLLCGVVRSCHGPKAQPRLVHTWTPFPAGV